MTSSGQFCDEQMQRRASSFAQTCNLLSEYIKQRGSLSDLNLEIDGKVESLESLVKAGSSNSMSDSTTINPPHDKGKSAEGEPDSSHNKPTSKDAADSTVAPLTIFYSGGVLVFEDYPASKAMELLAIAKKGSSQMSFGIPSNTLRATPAAISAALPLPPPPTEAGGPLRSAGITPDAYQAKIVAADSRSAASGSKSDPPIPQQIEANTSELRIARRTSIHKFLAKRKDRAAARGPYHQQVQGHGQPSSTSYKGDEHHLDLNL